MAEPGVDRGRNAAFTAVGQAFVLVGATAIGLVVAARLGKSARVDAYFAANQVFAAALFVGQGIRTTVPGLELAGLASAVTVRRAAAWIAAASLALLVIAAFVGPLLLPASTHDGFTRDLLLLAPGGALQIAGGYLAARLAMHQRFAGAALAYAGGTAANAVVLVALVGGSGASVLAPAALAGAVVAVGALAVLSWRAAALRPPALLEREPQRRVRRDPSAELGVGAAMGRILLSVTPVLVPQLMITSAVIGAASVQSGGSTLLTFAFLALNAVSTVAIAPIPIVLSSDLGVSWDRDPASLRPQVLAIVRVAVAVTVPATAGLFLLGRPIGEAALTSLTPADVTKILELVATLLPSLVLTAASMVALVAVITLDRLATLARLLAVCGVGAASTIALSVSLGIGLTGLVGVVAFWATAVAVVTLWVVFKAGTLRLCIEAVRAAVVLAGPGAAVLAAAWFLAGGVLAGLLATIIVTLVHAGWVRASDRVVFDQLRSAIAR